MSLKTIRLIEVEGAGKEAVVHYFLECVLSQNSPGETEESHEEFVYFFYISRILFILHCLCNLYSFSIKKGKAVPLHAMEALGEERSIAPTHSRPRH
jgi:hypothetical protein